MYPSKQLGQFRSTHNKIKNAKPKIYTKENLIAGRIIQFRRFNKKTDQAEYLYNVSALGVEQDASVTRVRIGIQNYAGYLTTTFRFDFPRQVNL